MMLKIAGLVSKFCRFWCRCARTPIMAETQEFRQITQQTFFKKRQKKYFLPLIGVATLTMAGNIDNEQVTF